MRLSWKKQPNEIGLSHTYQPPRGYDLRRDGQTLARVRPNGIYGSLWHWHTVDYPIFRNTFLEPLLSVEEAKAECLAWIKANQSKEDE